MAKTQAQLIAEAQAQMTGWSPSQNKSPTITGGVPINPPARKDPTITGGVPVTPQRTQTFTPTPGVDPTTNQPNSTVTGGVPIPTINQPKINRTQDLGTKAPTVREIGGMPSFQSDPEREKLTIRLEMGDSSLTPEELSTARDYLTEKVMYQRQQDPTAGVQKAYDRIQEQYNLQIKEQERERQQREQEMADTRSQRVKDYASNLNTVYEPEVMQAKEQGEVQKESVRSILSFSGFGRSTNTVEKLTQVDQNVDQRLRAIEAQKQAEAMRYQAQLEGADAETLSAMDSQISTLRNNANQLKLDSLVKIEELKLEAQGANDKAAMEQLQKLQASMLEDSKGVDVETSRANGFLTDIDGNPIYDESGKIQTMPKNYDFGTAITAANGAVSIPVFDELSGTFKMVDTGIRERVPGSGGSGTKDGKWENVIHDKTGNEIQQRKLADGTMEYRTITGKKIKPESITRTAKITTYSDPGKADPLDDIAKTLEAALKK